MYRNFYGDTWSDFNKETKGRELYLFGWNVARNILVAMNRYACPWRVIAVLDNDKNKHGLNTIPYTDIEVNIISPDELKGRNKNDILVLICGSYISEMAEQLESIGITNYYSEFWMSTMKGMRYHKHSIDNDTIDRLKGIMYDDKSVEIVDKIAKKRVTGFADYSDLYTRGSDYFRDEFWKPERHGVFVDAGGFTGDTIEEYNDWTKGDFNHIYSFEPQKDMCEIIESKLWKYQGRVTLIKKGLWSQDGSLHFVNGDGVFSGKINEGGENRIETTTLDAVVDETVTFLKMDIEGAETEAIKGAKRIITRDKPKLAICIYHLPSDLWEVPFLIHDLVPEYRLSIRHFGITCSDTVLFARI